MKNKIALYVLGGLAALLVIIQLIPGGPAENPPVTAEVQAAPEVMSILRRSCYDCHSNETEWPWYSHVAPVRWMIRHDVNEGRSHVNFSEFEGAEPRRMAHRLEEIGEQVEEGEMPLWYYVPLHPQARLTDADRELLRSWATERRAAIIAEHPEAAERPGRSSGGAAGSGGAAAGEGGAGPGSD